MMNKLKVLLNDGAVLENELLKNHTTFRVGGPAKAVLLISDEAELVKVIALLKEASEDFFIIGNGSNLLVSDKGYDGYVLKLSGKFLDVNVDGNIVLAGAGALLSKVCTTARDASLTGLEFAYGIPGTIGGAMVMNAGAYGGEMKDVVVSVTLLDKDLNILEVPTSDMHFGYRDSIIKHEEYIVLGAKFSLDKGDYNNIQATMTETMGKRRDKQPLEHPSAGSTFKRPEGAFAGKLIQDAGLSGYRVGGACVSPKHCGFVVNDQNGSAEDINNLMEYVAEKVYKESGFKLEPEVIRIGIF